MLQNSDFRKGDVQLHTLGIRQCRRQPTIFMTSWDTSAQSPRVISQTPAGAWACVVSHWFLFGCGMSLHHPRRGASCASAGEWALANWFAACNSWARS